MRRTRVIVCSMLAASITGAGVVTAGVGVAATAKPGTKANPIKAKEAVRGAFTPARTAVRNTRSGVTIYFRSTDRLPHNATPLRRIRGSVSPTSDRTFTLKLPAAYRGTLTYYCTVHPQMKGTLTVTS